MKANAVADYLVLLFLLKLTPFLRQFAMDLLYISAGLVPVSKDGAFEKKFEEIFAGISETQNAVGLLVLLLPLRIETKSS